MTVEGVCDCCEGVCDYVVRTMLRGCVDNMLERCV